jgi:hypothetical protein
MTATKRLWWAILLLAVLSPIGLILPHIFQSGPGWGEWGVEEIERMFGFVPEGLKRIAEIWSAPVPDYNLRGWEGKGLARMSFGYILSGVLGVGAIFLITFFLGKFLRKKG